MYLRDAFCFRFYQTIESHVFFDNYFGLEKKKNAIKHIELYKKRLRYIQKVNTAMALSAEEKLRYFDQYNRKRTSLLQADLDYADSFISLIRSHKKNGAPKILFKPALLTLGAILLAFDGQFSTETLKDLFQPGGPLRKGVNFYFEERLGVVVPFPFLSAGDPISDLKERIVDSLSLGFLNEDKQCLFDLAKRFVCASDGSFAQMVTTGNRYLYPMNIETFSNLLKREDQRIASEFVYIEPYDDKMAVIYAQIKKDLLLGSTGHKDFSCFF